MLRHVLTSGSMKFKIIMIPGLTSLLEHLMEPAFGSTWQTASALPRVRHTLSKYFDSSFQTPHCFLLFPSFPKNDFVGCLRIGGSP